MKIKRSDMMLFERIFEGSPGYIINFSNRTFAIFFDEELNIDIDDAVYLSEDESNSKAKRLRRLIEKSDQVTVLRVLDYLWAYKLQTDPAEAQHDQADFFSLRERISATNGAMAGGSSPVQAYSGVNYRALTDELNAMKELEVHQLGYRFESWLNKLFTRFRLKPREAFRNTGEQIDGSFRMDGEIYLMEAKWHKNRTPAMDLRDFQGKIREKATWTRGVFISWMGFTEEGLESFGRYTALSA